MIITRLMGGLGNQMFQYAAGLALSEARRTVLKLDVSWFKQVPEYESHNRYGLSCFNITEQFATEKEVERLKGVQLTRTERWSASVARAFRFFQYEQGLVQKGNTHRQEQFPFYPKFWTQPDDTYLDGMWQAEEFFAPIADLLRLHFSFRYPPPAGVAEMAKRIAGGPAIAVHFRRGDYAKNPIFSREIGVVSLDYYARALQQIQEMAPDATLYVFSDDIDAVEKEFRTSMRTVFVRATQPWHSYDKIRLMSLCDHLVISNSTFSWWAAWLNPSPTKAVIAPDPWFIGGERDGSGIAPKSWRRLPRNP